MPKMISLLVSFSLYGCAGSKPEYWVLRNDLTHFERAHCLNAYTGLSRSANTSWPNWLFAGGLGLTKAIVPIEECFINSASMLSQDQKN